jgi:hypothetical protein
LKEANSKQQTANSKQQQRPDGRRLAITPLWSLFAFAGPLSLEPRALN